MLKKECKKCNNKVLQLGPEGYCYICWDQIQNEELVEDISQSKMPEGLVAFWEDSVSYINKKQNRAYFKIPQTQKLRILDNKRYRIIIKEVKR